MALPIRHRIDHQMTYISVNDDAWDMDLIDAELGAIRAKKARTAELAALVDMNSEDPETLARIEHLRAEDDADMTPWADEQDHPWYRYRFGASRLDLTTVTDYLRPGAEPIKFKLCRAPLPLWNKVRDLLEGGENAAARTAAIAASLESIEGLDMALVRHGGKLSLDTLETLREKLGGNEFYNLGWAALGANAELSPGEG